MITSIPKRVAQLETWLESMRGPYGYTGPVAHWWQNCLQFTGTGLDWRYEGIIIGYLHLYQRTANAVWLHKARRAGDDLLRGQLENGNFHNSCFELNPYDGGTPHEAACALGLLRLAEALHEAGEPDASLYQVAAERNLRCYWIDHLWDAKARSFRDTPTEPSFVPNKAATLAEALFVLARLSGDERLAETYALPTVDTIIKHQLTGGKFDGAIYQNSFGMRYVAKFFPYYIARCVPGLLAAYAWKHSDQYLDAASRAMAFVLRWQYEDGSFAQVVYADGKANRYPQWVAAVGDILRAIDLLDTHGLTFDASAALEWMLRGQSSSGGFATGYGFAEQVRQRPPQHIEFRDVLPVCGWSDKAFCYLASHIPAGASLPDERTTTYETSCQVRGHYALWRESSTELYLVASGRPLYQWYKGQPWATIVASEALWK